MQLKKEIISLSTIFHSIICHSRIIDESNAEKKVFIIFPAFIGDFIIHLDMLNALSEYYQNNGYTTELHILNIPREFVNNYLTYDIIVKWDEEKFYEDIQYRKLMIKMIKKSRYYHVINPFWDPIIFADIIVSMTNSFHRILADRRKNYTAYFFKSCLCNLLRKSIYNQHIYLDRMDMEFIKQEKFLEEIGINKFLAHISQLKQIDTSINLNVPYCVISPGASKNGKRWDIKKFSTLISWLLLTYDLDIVIGGVSCEIHLANQLVESGDPLYCNRVHNWVGNLTLTEYIEVIRHSKLVITNDSSPVHIAASTNTPSVCIIGGWDYLRLLPYVTHEENDQTCFPIYTDQNYLNCFGCYEKGVAHNNKECKKRVKNKLNYCCIELITVEEVKNKVKSILGKSYE